MVIIADRRRAIIAVLCSACCCAIAVLWVISEHHTQLLYWSRSGRAYAIRSDRGRVRLECVTGYAKASAYQGGWELLDANNVRDDLNVHPSDRSFANGFGFERLSSTGYWRGAVPYWFLLALAGWQPIALLVQWTRRKRRLHKGLCGECGYDLRGTPGSCPECGWGHR